MSELSYSEVIAILAGTKLPYISISRDGVFVDDMGCHESSCEYDEIRRMEYTHPQKDITKPLFTFPCTIQELRTLLHDCDAVGQLSGVIYLERNQKYTASQIIDVMVEASIKETSLLPPEQSLELFSIEYKKKFLDDHDGQKQYYQESIIKFLSRYSISITMQDADKQLKDISLENIMSDVISWLQVERFAVLVKSTVETSTKTNTKKITRSDPVREAMQNLQATNPNINTIDMWAALQKMARDNIPPFIDEQDEHTLFYTAGGNAKTDQKKLKYNNFVRRFNRL